VDRPSILVTGASGDLGNLVVRALDDGSARVISGSRTPAADARRIDFDDATSLLDGFQQVDRMLLVSTDELAVPGKRQRQHHAAIDAARKAGVSYVAYTSMPNPATSPAIFFAEDHVATEQMLAESRIPAGILRNGWYQENLLAYLPHIIADGSWFTAAGAGRIPHVARDDAARAAASLLRTAELGIFDIAGPHPLTIEEIAAAVETVLGRALRVIQVDSARLAVELARQGISAPIIPMVVATEENQHAGRFEIGPETTRKLIGRAPRPLHDFLRNHAEALLARAR
jgi:NAD(P)H dehydrogenase (quinone)